MFIRHPTMVYMLPDNIKLEDDWVRHDGARRVLPDGDRSLILLRDGTIFRPISTLPNKWGPFYELCRWEWKVRDRSTFDVMAYREIE